MKNRNRFIIALVFLTLTSLLSSCLQNEGIYPTPNYPLYPTYPTNNALPSVSVQNYDFENYNGFSGHLSQGAYLQIPSNAFVDKNGYVFQGRVNLAITEIIKKSDMFLANISTVSNNLLLQSGGMLNIVATHDNSILTINPGIHISASFPVKGATLKMQVFNGDTAKSRFLDWTLTKDSVNNYVTVTKDSMSTGASFFYALTTSGLNWINCDHFADLSPLTTVKIGLSTPGTYTGTTCAIIFPFSSLAMLSPDTGTNNFIINNMPVGTSVTVVVYGVKSGHAYAAFVPTTITANMKLAVPLAEMSNTQFDAKLKALD